MKKSLLYLTLLFLIPTAVKAQETKVLFIGNSYTYVNDLPGIFDSIATHLNKPVITGSKTNGGYTFQNHYNDAQTFNAMHQNDWDLIVLQAQSQEPSFPYDQVNTSTLPYSTLLADSAFASGECTNVMYYMTWGRENGDPQWDSINTFDKMNQRLYDAYMRFADVADAMVSPVAVAWKYVRDNYPTIQLYSSDGSHPSMAGTYLIACTFYTSVFQESPVGVNYLAGLDANTASILQNAAATTVLNNLNLYGLHSIDYRTVADFEWNIDANGLISANDLSIHEESLEWIIDGTHYTSEQVSHQLTNPGTYTITLIATSACNSDTSVAVVNYNNAGIETGVSSSTYVYPNPSNGKVQFEGFQNAMVLVHDLNGRFLFEHKITDGKVDLTALENGIYIVEIDNQFIRIQIQK